MRACEALAPTRMALDAAAIDYANARLRLGSAALDEAVSFYVRHHRAPVIQKSVAETLEIFLERKIQAGRSVRYVEDLRNRLKPFARDFQTRIDSITCEQIEEFIQRFEWSPRSTNNFLRVLRTLFAFAKARGFMPKTLDPLEGIEWRDDNGGEISIFRPDEMRRLLEAARLEIVPALAIGAFAGLRSAEIERLDWREVRLDNGFIEVKAAKAKTASRRLVPITPNLAAWLLPHAADSELVWKGRHVEFYDLRRGAAKAAGIDWRDNALRHSFISYRLADIQNAAQVSLEAGNSPQMVFRHYRELVRPAEAKAWFSIVPPKEEA